MRVQFLGIGGAFDPQFGNSSLVIQPSDAEAFLIDCGGSVYTTLCRTGWIDAVSYVMVTHLHDDHMGSLGSLVYHAHYITRRKLTLLFPPILEEPLRALFRLQMGGTAPEHYVNMHVLRDSPGGGTTQVGDLALDWIDTSGRHHAGIPSVAYVVTHPAGTIAYSGDLGDPDLLFEELGRRNVANPLVFHDTSFVKLASKAHAYYKDLERHMDCCTVLGYHNDPTKVPPDMRLPLVFNDRRFWPPQFENPGCPFSACTVADIR